MLPIIVFLALLCMSLPFVLVLCICECYFPKDRNKTEAVALKCSTQKTVSAKQAPIIKSSKHKAHGHADKSKDHKQKKQKIDDLPTAWNTSVLDDAGPSKVKEGQSTIGQTKADSIAGKNAHVGQNTNLQCNLHHSKVQLAHTSKLANNKGTA